MPIRIPDKLPAKKTLESENIFVMTGSRATQQDIRPLEIAVLNLMPTKIETETQLARLLGSTPLQVNLTLLTTKSYKAKNTAADHLIDFYTTWDKIRDKKYDGLIITGAPVEQLDWQDVDYWQELTQILDWSLTHVHSCFFICWGAQAALQHFYGVPKHATPAKQFGIYAHKVIKKNAILLRGFDDAFWVPVSRHTETRREDIAKIKELEILAESKESGLYLLRDKKRRHIFSFNHAEYDPETLKAEYDRDIKRGLSIAVPANYFPDDNPAKAPLVRWRAHAHLLFANWLNYYVYQDTPYDLGDIGK